VANSSWQNRQGRLARAKSERHEEAIYEEYERSKQWQATQRADVAEALLRAQKPSLYARHPLVIGLVWSSCALFLGYPKGAVELFTTTAKIARYKLLQIGLPR
jgi:hypothetical protein